MKALLAKLSKKYPHAVILGHRDLSPDKNSDGLISQNEWMKVCPCFDAGAWAKSVGLRGGKFARGKFVVL
jgi:N-acetylmuramoyl-L-alanine amidase